MDKLTLFYKDGTAALKSIKKIDSVKVLKKIKTAEIEALNVAEICDVLQSDLRRLNHGSTGAVTENGSCVNSLLHCSAFQECSSIWFGSLLILRQQCNNLLDDTLGVLSRSFESHSTIDSIKADKRIKRKTTSPSSSHSPKIQRLTQKSKEDTPNFVQLLDECWQLASMQTETAFVSDDQTSLLQASTQFCINNMSDNFDMPDEYSDDFGYATAEEIKYFLGVPTNNNIDDDVASSKKIRKPVKRGATDQSHILPVKMRISGHLQNMANDRNDMNASIEMLNRCNKLNNSEADVAETIVIPRSHNESTENIYIPETNIKMDLNENLTPNENTCNNKLTPALPEIYHQIHSTLNHQTDNSKCSKLIIDKKTELTRDDLINQTTKYYEQIVKTFQTITSIRTQNEPDKDIFKTFRLSHLFPFEVHGNGGGRNEYKSILGAIFDADCNDDLINDIVENTSQGQNDEEDVMVANYIEMKRILNIKPTVMSFEKNCNCCTPVNIISVMLMLLDMLGGEQKINAVDFLSKFPCRQQAALAFRHLLELANDKFLILFQKLNSCEIGKILLGMETCKIISEVKDNN